MTKPNTLPTRTRDRPAAAHTHHGKQATCHWIPLPPTDRTADRQLESKTGEGAASGPPGGWGPLDYSPDGSLLAVAHKSITILEVGTWRPLKTLAANEHRLGRQVASQIGALTFSQDGKRPASTCHDGTAIVWRLDDAFAQWAG